ncbi:MAG: hypothetical protein ACI9HK_000153 [Pirellulaceae bacterium]|jgi:hypothetical protein
MTIRLQSLRLFAFMALLALPSCFATLANAQQLEYQAIQIPTISTNGGFVEPRDIDTITIDDIDHIIVVGEHTPDGPDSVGFVYDHDGVIGDPGTVYSLDQWIPHSGLGWSKSRCSGLNTQGQVVGLLEKVVNGERVRVGFYLDLDIFAATPTPTWEYLPEPAGSTFSYGRDINNNGDVLAKFSLGGVQHAYLFNPTTETEYNTLKDPATGAPLTVNDATLNDFRQVAGQHGGGGGTFLLNPGVSLETLPLAYANGINNIGTVIGSADQTVETGTGKKTTTTTLSVAAQVTFDGLEPLNDTSSGSSDINPSGDVIGKEYVGRNLVFLSHSELGLLYLDELVTGSQGDMDFWFSADTSWLGHLPTLNSRNSSGFGPIAVAARKSTTSGKGKNQTTTVERRCFMLIPVWTTP